MDEGRYWVIQDEEGVNRLHAVSIAAGYTVVGLVDEEAGQSFDVPLGTVERGCARAERLEGKVVG